MPNQPNTLQYCKYLSKYLYHYLNIKWPNVNRSKNAKRRGVRIKAVMLLATRNQKHMFHPINNTDVVLLKNAGSIKRYKSKINTRLCGKISAKSRNLVIVY